MKRSSAGSIIRSAPETAYPEGSVCQATGPEGVTNTGTNATGICGAARAAASPVGRSCAKSWGKNAGSIVASDPKANGVLVQMKWGDAAGGLNPVPRLTSDSP